VSCSRLQVSAANSKHRPLPKSRNAGTHCSQSWDWRSTSGVIYATESDNWPIAKVTERAILIMIVTVMTLGVAHAQDTQRPPLLVGEVTLTEKDVDQVIALAGRERPIWMIDSGWACLPAICLRATVYFRPELESSVLRRGYAMDLAKGTGKDLTWDVWDREWAWAQVALPGKPFGKELGRPSEDTFPFRVFGIVPDQQLVAMVQFIRHPPFYERLFHRLDGVPIKAIKADPNGDYTVYEEPEFLYMQTVKLSSEAGGWRIESVSGGRVLP